MKNAITWLRLRFPHIQRKSDPDFSCWRLYGFKPYFRLCLIDYTRTSFFVGKPEYRRLRVLKWTVYEANRAYSGLPLAG